MSDLCFLSCGLFVSYLVGSIPSGYLIGRYWLGVDITEHGSGNIGATNLARTAASLDNGRNNNKPWNPYEWLANIIKYFFIVFALDAGKAFLTLKVLGLLIASSYASWFVVDYLMICALAIFIGNLYSLFLGFSGGKGVATMIGISCYLIPSSVIALFGVVWLVVMAITRQSFLASISAALSMLVGYFICVNQCDSLFFFLATIVVFVLFRHRSNIVSYMNVYRA